MRQNLQHLPPKTAKNSETPPGSHAAQSIYIDWGSFINAVINFFLIAFVLFSIVKIIHKIKIEGNICEGKLFEKKVSPRAPHQKTFGEKGWMNFERFYSIHA